MVQETLEEARKNYISDINCELFSKQINDTIKSFSSDAFEQGVRCQAERSYSEEDIKKLFESIISKIERRKKNIISNSEIMTPHLLEGGCMAFKSSQDVIKEQFEQFKKK